MKNRELIEGGCAQCLHCESDKEDELASIWCYHPLETGEIQDEPPRYTKVCTNEEYHDFMWGGCKLPDCPVENPND